MQGLLWSHAYYCGYCAELDLDYSNAQAQSLHGPENAPQWLRGSLQLGSMVGPAVCHLPSR